MPETLAEKAGRTRTEALLLTRMPQINLFRDGSRQPHPARTVAARISDTRDRPERHRASLIPFPG